MRKGSLYKFCGVLAATVISLCLLCALAVCIFDPFYHYHAPLPGLKAVLTEKEYQVVGSLRHFEYDTVLVGSSVVENNDNRWYDEAFGGTTVKAVRSYGGIADLVWLLDEAFGSQEIRQVFFNLDTFALVQEAQTTFEETGCPMYLYDDNPVNDIRYLLNRTVLFEKIPYMIAQSLSGDYEEALSYNWAEGKDFSREGVLANYERPAVIAPMEEENAQDENLRANLALLEALVEAHPETQFTFFLPPYSMVWWDDAYREGLSDVYIACEKQAAKALLSYDNVRFYDFQNEAEIITDLDNYMDTIHFSPDINYWICEAIRGGVDEVTPENLEETFFLTAAMVRQNEEGAIRELEEAGAFRYAESGS